MPEISMTIPGTPIAKARPRFARAGKFVKTYSAQETEEGKFRWDMLNLRGDNEPISAGVPIELKAIFYMPIPASISKKKRESLVAHIKKPDLDNLLKFLKDCANGILWEDDSQVYMIRAGKMYDEHPRTVINLIW